MVIDDRFRWIPKKCIDLKSIGNLTHIFQKMVKYGGSLNSLAIRKAWCGIQASGHWLSRCLPAGLPSLGLPCMVVADIWAKFWLSGMVIL